MRLSDLAEIKATNSNIDNLFDYFNNDDFVWVNRERNFTPMEQIAIIVHSDTRKVPLTKRFEDLRLLEDKVDDEVKEDVEFYIDRMSRIVDFVKSLNDDRYMFLINFDNTRVVNPKLFKTYQEATRDGFCLYDGLNIEAIHDDSLGEYSGGNVGHIDYCDNGIYRGEIANISINRSLFEMANLPKKDKTSFDIFKIQVRLNSPFQPFDLMELPLNRCYYIVADVDEDEMNKLTEENNTSKYSSRKPYDWLQLDVPFYDEQYDGTIETRCINYFRFTIGQIKRVPVDDMKLRTYEHIKELRERIGNK